ncbi:zinc metalloproteinase nas-15 isoform X2 [Nematostella vectensis]|uniref:zinc metalloproteinase nas-15 isoform X2 n=1 Tax=Nematostella vectensis TaxID=45351 RepID=UPI0020772BF2|nr:zinc metalloproteinase nas-15 isoform X2 [Nematostella vectensis]
MRNFILFVLVTTAFAVNPEENEGGPDLFEGDIKLDPAQRWALLDGMGLGETGLRGSMIGNQWPGGLVPYTIDASLKKYSDIVSVIMEGMREWSSKTCIKFKKRTNERGYINFKSGFGCFSNLGYLGIKQDIVLGQGCWKKGIVAHEIAHALGFLHEQSRPDRDQYVTIVWNNIADGKIDQFKIYGSIDSLGTPYDYGSVMHYAPRAFTKNGQPTIVPKQSGVRIGQREGVSAIDAKQMDLLYKRQCSGGGDGGYCFDKHHSCSDLLKYCKAAHMAKWLKTNCKKTCGHC